MPNRNKNRPNALKHGAFAQITILPGEDRHDFEKLHSALIEEWTPIGPTEEDAVVSIANSVWRKRRVQQFIEISVRQSILDPGHKAHHEGRALRAFLGVIKAEPNNYETALMSLSRRLQEYLKEYFPETNFDSTSERIDAVAKEITSKLLPEVECELPYLMLARSVAVLDQDLFQVEVAVTERLDAMIDRAIKRLIQTKAMKQMLGPLSPNGGDGQLKKIQSRKSNGSVNHPAR